MSELTTAQEREYVESKWVGVTIEYNNCGMENSYWSVTTQDGTELAHIYSGALCGNGPAIHAAFLFTQEREERVRQIKGDMRWLKSHCWITDSGGPFEEDNPELSRTLALLQREIEQAKQGWKG